MLMLRSENLFECTADIPKLVLSFLDRPARKLGPSQIHKNRDKDEYEQKMDPAAPTAGIITVDLDEARS